MIDKKSSPLQALEISIFHGQATALEARVYVALPRLTQSAGYSLRGSITGPLCEHAATLPAEYPLIDAGPGATPLAVAILAEPCFWTPRLPSRYQVHVELSQHGEVVGAVSREFGLRPLAARGASFVFEQVRWVLRGAAARIPIDWRAWHDGSMSAILKSPPNEVLAEATRLGVLVVADATATSLPLTPELDRLACHACVGMALVEPANYERSRRPPNLLVGCFTNSNEAPPADMDFMFREVSQISIDPVVRLDASRGQKALPTVAFLRCNPSRETPQQLREECDLLQAELAPRGDFAGYVVL